MSDSATSQPHGLQPTRLLHTWDFPGKSTGVGCHCLLPILVGMKVKSESEIAQSCPTLSDPMDCSLPGSSVHEPRAKIKPADPPAGESGTGQSSVCRLRRVPGWREPRRAHLRPPPSPPCLKRSGLPTGEGMATPPKRSCPSPAASSEGTRIKKISIEGNIGKGPREMLVPKQG